MSKLSDYCCPQCEQARIGLDAYLTAHLEYADQDAANSLYMASCDVRHSRGLLIKVPGGEVVRL